MSHLSYSEPAQHTTYLGRKYFPELDGLRAISVLLVISVHLYDSTTWWHWLSGARGVTIFFILSGYLITTLALREEDQHGRLSLLAFFIRRTCRIFPMYYLVLGLHCLLIFGLGISSHLGDMLWKALPYYLLYLQEIPFSAWQALEGKEVVFYHSWTLGAEEKFYLFWPLLAFVLWAGSLRSRLRGTLVLMLVLACVPLVLSPLGPVPKVVGRMLFCYASLLAGCLLAFLLHDARWFARLRFFGRTSVLVPVVLVFLVSHFATAPLDPGTLASDLNNILYTLATTALLACLLLGRGPLQTFLSTRPLTFVGRLSYGIYLVHMLAMYAVYRVFPGERFGLPGSIAVLVMTTLLSVALAWVLHISVERYFIGLGRRWSQNILARPARVGPTHPVLALDLRKIATARVGVGIR